ncbi:MAG: arylsulfatase [Planctomycetes bacterium]|nr:arylsulfatase [Planctomycetota bacterium]
MTDRRAWAVAARIALAAGVLLGVSGWAADASPSRPNIPNILFLMADQLRGDAIGADGNPIVRTPNLDRLAAEGVRFCRAYSSVPSCTPARATILTGLAPWHHGMLGYGRVAPAYARELPRMLRDAGYYTLGIGKMHYHPQRITHGFHRTILDESGRVESPGFVSDYRQWLRSVAPDADPDATGIGWNDHRAKAYVLPERLHPTKWTGDQAVQFIEGYEDEAPFFLKVSFARPHSPYDPPQRWWDAYADAALPPAVVGDWAERHARRGLPHRNDLWQGDLGPETVRAARQGYYGNVSFIDENVGRILAALRKRGWLERTLILFTADHGDMLGDHHLWRKTYPYEGSARIPMIIRWPEGSIDAPRGKVIDRPVELRDILPTFLDAGGVPYEKEWFDGRSLLDLVRGRDESWRKWIDLEHARCYAPENYWSALTDGRMKYVYFAPDGREQLFDLRTDPGETRDLAPLAEHRATLATWRRRLVEHLAERGKPFVVDGDLGLRPQSILYGPNYPRAESPEKAAAKK